MVTRRRGTHITYSSTFSLCLPRSNIICYLISDIFGILLAPLLPPLGPGRSLWMVREYGFYNAKFRPDWCHLDPFRDRSWFRYAMRVALVLSFRVCDPTVGFLLVRGQGLCWHFGNEASVAIVSMPAPCRHMKVRGCRDVNYPKTPKVA